MRTGTLVAGLVFLAVAAGFALDVAGAWHPRVTLLVPVVLGGMALAAVTGAVTGAVREHRARDDG
ncbi:exported protein of unknown function [Streptantibioticus cattleyicolor NRRL 8057 = DSM 46488]|nr:exported protein of unknown function [Streptantibioticus cattleyicolor NRRL 8057 = DSM 46488]